MTNKDQQNLTKYFQQHSHAIDTSFCHDWLSLNQTKPWENVVILPVCGEDIEVLETVFKNLKDQSFLVILIINRPDKHTKTEYWQHQNNQLVSTLIHSASQMIESSEGHLFTKGKTQIDCLILNFNELPFNVKKGVGLARKIAADTALDLIQSGWIEHPWIFSTDADVELPSDYFAVIDDASGTIVAFSLDFVHVGNDETALIHQSQYDFKLRYYQQGVQLINHKYAYIPLGSTLVIHASAYVKVRGFPTKSAGEDFYILNKLAKVGDVQQTTNPIISIRTRYSDRVPFGTGPAINKLAKASEPTKYYHPKIFHVLKSWRESLLAYFNTKTMPYYDNGLNDFWHLKRVLNKALKQIKSQAHWNKFIDDWFDGFKILKSVHLLSKYYLPLEHCSLKANKAYQDLMKNNENLT